jgi:hypothetical protein
MDTTWLYGLSNMTLMVGITSLFMSISVGGLLISRRTFLREPHMANDVAANYSAAVGVIYAVLLAMIAVASWQNYTTADDLVNKEANVAWEIFHNFGGYPEPEQSALRHRLRDYVTIVIEEEWPAEHLSLRDRRADLAIDLLVADQMKFQPHGDKQNALFSQSLQLIDRFVGTRNLRLLAGRSGLMPQMWVVVVVGALVNVAVTYFVWMKSLKLQAALTGLLALIIGLMIYMIFAMDHPVLGEMSIQPDALVNLEHNMDQIMNPLTPGQRRVSSH